MTATVKDRRGDVAKSTSVNGIDYVEVDAFQTTLIVHFLNDLTVTLADPTKVTITGGDSIPSVAVVSIAPGPPDSRGCATSTIISANPGDFSNYTLTLHSSDLDIFLARATFSFKASCPSTLDCEEVIEPCEPPAESAPALDYLAKDFDSFKRALLDFSAQYYPAWQERSEADFGVMFAEALSSIADDLSYQQDRITGEAYLETARERRSLVRLARLVDYEPRVATAARVTLWFEVRSPLQTYPTLRATTRLADGTVIEFETVARPESEEPNPPPDLHDGWNGIEPYWFDDTERCLCCGATEMWIERPSRLPHEGQRILIETRGPSTADLPVCEIVTLTGVEPLEDKLPANPVKIVRLTWSEDEKLAFEHDLTRTTVRGNLVDATHGRRHIDRFVVESVFSGTGASPRATVRVSAGGEPQFLHTLQHSPLAWLANGDKDPEPEIEVREVGGEAWKWHPKLIEARSFDPVYTVDPARFVLLDRQLQISEYDGDQGSTIRFGDGTRGRVPRENTVFQVSYRVGGGARGNVAASTLTKLDPGAAALGITAVNNPFPAKGGRDEESVAQIRENAPQRFRRKPLRAVRPEDYERAAMEDAQRIQRAGTQFRYTGSWLSVFTSVDPRGTETLRDDLRLSTTQQLDRRRMAGYESFVLPPRFAPIDLEVTVCAVAGAFRGDVERDCLRALDTREHRDGTLGFFHPDRFTFGAPLERSAIEAVLQDTPGLDGVIAMRYRWRGHTRAYVKMPDAVAVGRDEIVRCDNDPDHPEHGSLRIIVRGGK